MESSIQEEGNFGGGAYGTVKGTMEIVWASSWALWRGSCIYWGELKSRMEGKSKKKEGGGGFSCFAVGAWGGK